MASPEDKAIEKSYQALKSRIGKDSSDLLTVRELLFSRLVAEESYTYTDAYVEAFQPSETATKDSIYQMSSRIAGRPRVQAEMDRIRRELEDDKLKREERLGVALNPVVGRERMAIEIYAIATGSKDEDTRLKAWKLFGSLRHIDAFVSTNSPAEDPNAKLGTFGIRAGANSEEIRVQFMDKVKQIMGSRAKEQLIEVPKEQDNVGE